MTTLELNDSVLDFLVHELRTIRPSLPPRWPAAALYKADLGLDSLDLVELIARIEQRHGLMVPDADLPQFVSLEATAAYIAEHGAR